MNHIVDRRSIEHCSDCGGKGSRPGEEGACPLCGGLGERLIMRRRCAACTNAEQSCSACREAVATEIKAAVVVANWATVGGGPCPHTLEGGPDVPCFECFRERASRSGLL
jgi:hypothetical protein